MPTINWHLKAPSHQQAQCCPKTRALVIQNSQRNLVLCHGTWKFNIPCHYNDITYESWHLKSLTTQLFVQHSVKVNPREDIKATDYWHFVRGIYVMVNHKEDIKATDYCPFVRGIHLWLNRFLPQKPVTWKASPCHDIIVCFIMFSDYSVVIQSWVILTFRQIKWPTILPFQMIC